MKLANRTREVEFFTKMLRGDLSQRILLIQGASGMGKTTLLAKFASVCSVHADATLLAQVELKSATTGIPYIFSRVQRQLGEDKFTQFNEAITQFLSAGVEISDNKLEGTGNKIQLVLNAESEESRNIRLNNLQEAFFRDLQAIKKPILIVFDTFNEAPASLANWIGGVFLSEIANIKNICVVIAGQSVPKPTIEWISLSETHCLDAINDIEVWHSFLQANKLPFSRETVQAFVLLMKGKPSIIIQGLETVARRLAP